MNLRDTRVLQRTFGQLRTSRSPFLPRYAYEPTTMNLNPPLTYLNRCATGETLRARSSTRRHTTPMLHALSGLFGMLLLTLAPLACATEADDILGDWVSAGGHSRIKIFKRDAAYFGRIERIKHTHFRPGEVPGRDGQVRTDLHNPDAALRERSLVGIELMRDFVFDGKRWVKGRIYDPQSGRLYQCVASLTPEGQLSVRGYVGLSLLGRTTHWERFTAYRERELEFLKSDPATDPRQARR